MFHPGGFGEFKNEDSGKEERKDPSVFKPVLFLIGILLIWVSFFVGGLSLGFGWFAWPAGTIFLALGFLFFAFVRKFKKK